MKQIITGNYRSFNELVKAIHLSIQGDLDDVIKQVAEDIKKTLYDYIYINWYKARKWPDYYARTYDFIQSLSVDKIKTVGNKKEISVYFDESKINSYETPSGFWNAHMSIDGSTDYQGQSIGWWIVSWINAGQNSPLYSYNGIQFIDEILNDSDKFIKEVADLLKRKGYVCIVK